MSEGQKNLLTAIAAIFIILITAVVLYFVLPEDDRDKVFGWIPGLNSARKQAIEDFGEDYLAMCDTMPQGSASLSNGPQTMNPTYRALVLEVGEGMLHDWHEMMPDNTRANSREEVDVVVCVGKIEKNLVERCQYLDRQSGDYVVAYDRMQLYQPIKVINVHTGAIIGNFSATGTPPPFCGSSIEYQDRGSVEELKGGDIGFSEFYSVTRDYLRDYGR